MKVHTIFSKPTRAFTGDRGPPQMDISSGFLVTEQLGPKRRLLPNGTLLCLDVPIARTGWMLYAPGETPIPAGSTGAAHVHREASELFSASTLASFMAVPVTDKHPPGGYVDSKNSKMYSRGFSTTNIRQGTGDDADVMLADIIITDQELIEKALNGTVEVSAGYAADYEVTGSGEGRQTNIIGNHIALVDKGRCGPRCAIGDHATLSHSIINPTEGTEMPIARKAISGTPSANRKRIDELNAEIDQLEEEEQGGENDTHIHVHVGDAAIKDGDPPTNDAMDKRLTTIETGMKAVTEAVAGLTAVITGKKTTDGLLTPEQIEAAAEAKRVADAALANAATTDSAALETGYKAVMSDAEVLVPGYRFPTFDATAKRAVTIDTMCNARRRVLDMAYATGDGQSIIDGVAGTEAGKLDLVKADCSAVATIFTAAAGAKRMLNNRQVTGDGKAGNQQQDEGQKVWSIADQNKANAEYWAKHA